MRTPSIQLLVAAALALSACAHSPSGAAVAVERPADDPADARTMSGNSPVRGFKNVPAPVFDREMINGPTPHLPDAVLLALKGRHSVSGIYKICANSDGEIVQVTTIESIPGGDAAVIAGIRTWRLKPQPIGLCKLSRFIFAIQ